MIITDSNHSWSAGTPVCRTQSFFDYCNRNSALNCEISDQHDYKRAICITDHLARRKQPTNVALKFSGIAGSRCTGRSVGKCESKSSNHCSLQRLKRLQALLPQSATSARLGCSSEGGTPGEASSEPQGVLLPHPVSHRAPSDH